MRWFAVGILLLALMTACGPVMPRAMTTMNSTTSASTTTSSSNPTPTPSPIPTPSPTPLPTVTPSPTPLAPPPTPTPAPTSTPTPTPTPTPIPSPTPSSCLKILDPSYVYPYTTAWNQTVAASSAVAIMIANPNSGPGTTVDTNYASAIAQAQKAGVKVLGYVYTGYGARAASAIEADIDNYYTWYKVDGIFLDEASTSSTLVSFYKTLYQYIHTKASGATVVLNPGTFPDQGYVAASDIIVTFEDVYANYLNLQTPSWVLSYPSSHFAHIIYGASGTTALAQTVTLALQRNVAYVYVTDQTLPNPYGALPSYWSTETSNLCH